MLSVSTSPRLNLEFAKCRIEDRQEWITNGIRSELAACEACGEDATALKVVVTLPGEKEVIVGFAIWLRLLGWPAVVAGYFLGAHIAVAVGVG